MSEAPGIAKVDSPPKNPAWRVSLPCLNPRILAPDNSLVPARQLPAEILSTIFLILCGAFPASDNLLTGGSLSPPWIAVTHVCRAWRTAALDCPFLWTTLPLASPAFTRLALTRTKDAIVSVKKYIRSEADAEIVQELLLAKSERLGRVELKFTPPIGLGGRRQCNRICLPVFEVMQKTLKKSAGILESLTLERHLYDPHPIPELFQPGQALALREVSLHDFEIGCTNVPFPSSLTRLSLLNDRYTRRQMPTWEEVLEVLAGLPLLVDLELHSALPVAPQDPGERKVPSIVVRSLKQLYLRDMLHPIANLLENIRLPGITFIHLYAHAVDHLCRRSVTQISHILSQVQSIAPGYRRPLQHLKYRAISDIEGTELPSNQKFVLRFEAASPSLAGPELQISLSPLSLPLQGLLDAFNRCFDLTTLVSMEVLGNKHIPFATWTSTFEHCNALKELTLIAFYRSFVRALDAQGPSWLPSLSILRLQSVSFKRTDDNLEILSKALKKRSAAGCPPLELIVDSGKYRNFSTFYEIFQGFPNLAVNWVRDSDSDLGFAEAGYESELGSFGEEEELAEGIERYEEECDADA